MQKRKADDSFEARLMSREQGASYTGLGRTRFTDWARSIGAERRFGRRVLFDRQVIDAALDKMVTG